MNELTEGTYRTAYTHLLDEQYGTPNGLLPIQIWAKEPWRAIMNGFAEKSIRAGHHIAMNKNAIEQATREADTNKELSSSISEGTLEEMVRMQVLHEEPVQGEKVYAIDASVAQYKRARGSSGISTSFLF